MPADAFAFAVAWVIKAEGSAYTNVAQDAGGPTHYGVCMQTLTHWHAMHGLAPATVDDVRDLTQEKAIAIFRGLYWDQLQGDYITSSPIACALLDAAVLCGPPTITRMAQGILGVAMDGRFGPKTLAALNKQNATSFLLKFVPALQDHLDKIVELNPSQMKFYPGWVRRTGKLLALAS